MPSDIEGRCDHGVIVNALADALHQLGVQVANDQNRDLYVPGENGWMKSLFEAKTDVSTSTVYQAIGQLLYHSATQSPRPPLVMVLPADPDQATRRVLQTLSISVLVFDWQDQRPHFQNLPQVIAAMTANPR